MEQESELVELGKFLHETSYQREKKEIMIDNTITIDFTDNDKIIHEVKKSNKIEKAHIWQLKYYLYYLKQKGVPDVIGELNYPKLKKIEKVSLTNNDEKELKKIFVGINEIISQEVPPPAINKSFCKKCAYYEFCYV
jgi:CRISPR-associated exonuclease Cas4